jgi:hypothetical protein
MIATYRFARHGDAILAFYDTGKYPETEDIDGEIVAFVCQNRVFLHPELRNDLCADFAAVVPDHEVIRLEYGTESIFHAVESNRITAEEALAQVFALRTTVSLKGEATP